MLPAGAPHRSTAAIVVPPKSKTASRTIRTIVYLRCHDALADGPVDTGRSGRGGITDAAVTSVAVAAPSGLALTLALSAHRRVSLRPGRRRVGPFGPMRLGCYFSRRERRRSARGFPPVWQVGQY